MTVTFVDTSVLCNLVPVPGFDQDRASVLEAMDQRMSSENLILPVTAVIETGNHIAHLPDGGRRRTAASAFAAIIEFVLSGQAPWTFHEFRWDAAFVRSLLAGGGSGTSLVEHAMAGTGVGDLCILAERRAYAEAALVPVGIWTLDRDLHPYADPWRPSPGSPSA